VPDLAAVQRRTARCDHLHACRCVRNAARRCRAFMARSAADSLSGARRAAYRSR
jgi:hypothetical protein